MYNMASIYPSKFLHQPTFPLGNYQGELFQLDTVHINSDQVPWVLVQPPLNAKPISHILLFCIGEEDLYIHERVCPLCQFHPHSSLLAPGAWPEADKASSSILYSFHKSGHDAGIVTPYCNKY